MPFFVACRTEATLGRTSASQSESPNDMDVAAAAPTIPSGSTIFVAVCKGKHSPTVVDLADFVDEVIR